MKVYLVDKPLGISSHDVVNRARRLLGTRQVGHSGTLDPLASGLLVLLVDGATKLSPFLSGADKGYLAWVAFGAATATLDAEGPIVERGDASWVDGAAVAAALPRFLTLEQQLPPAYSAVKRGGVRSYRAARRGEDLSLPPRPAGYHAAELLAFAAERGALPQRFAPAAGRRWHPSDGGRSFVLPEILAPLPTALIWTEVRSGTYLRAFARDLGAELGVPAHLSGLVRTHAGDLGLASAVPLEALPESEGIPPTSALPYPLISIDEATAARTRLGQRPSLRAEGRVGLIDDDGLLVAVAEVREGRTRLLRVWPRQQLRG